MSKDLIAPPGFRRRMLHKAGGGFRCVFTYTDPKHTNDRYELRRAEEACIKHAKWLERATLRRNHAAIEFSYVSDGWHWKYESRSVEYKQNEERVRNYFGEVRFRPPLECVREHLLWGRGPYFLKMDLRDAFGSVTYDRFSEFTNDGWVRRNKYRYIPCSKHIYRGWPFFHPRDGGLIQGASTSPYLFERYCLISGLDDFLLRYGWNNKFTITRYVDDIVISSPRPFGSKVRGTLRRALDEFGFEVNHNKTKEADIREEPFEFLGVSLDTHRVRVDEKFIRSSNRKGMSPARARWKEYVDRLNMI